MHNFAAPRPFDPAIGDHMSCRFVVAMTFFLLPCLHLGRRLAHVSEGQHAGRRDQRISELSAALAVADYARRARVRLGRPAQEPIEGLVMKHRARFDDAHHVAIVGDRVYFGSAVDHQVRCVDAATGQTVWRFFTGGPVRLAPTVHQGRVYFGSDDGWVYCLEAATGREVWKMRVGPRDERLLARGQMISRWPVRTGVLIADDVAYFGAGIFPARDRLSLRGRCADGQAAVEERPHQPARRRTRRSVAAGLSAGQRGLAVCPFGQFAARGIRPEDGRARFQEELRLAEHGGRRSRRHAGAVERRAALLGRFASFPGAEREDRRRGLCLHSRPAVDLPRHARLHRHRQGSDCRRSRSAHGRPR